MRRVTLGLMLGMAMAPAPAAQAVVTVADDGAGTLAVSGSAPKNERVYLLSHPGGFLVKQKGLSADQGGCGFDATLPDNVADLAPGSLLCPGVKAVDLRFGDGADWFDGSRSTVPMHLVAGSGADRGFTGAADDVIDVRDDEPDAVSCGPGHDRLAAAPDPADELLSCEATSYSWGQSDVLPPGVAARGDGTVVMAVGTATHPVKLFTTLRTSPPRGAATHIIGRSVTVNQPGPARVLVPLREPAGRLLAGRPALRISVMVVAEDAAGHHDVLRMPLSGAPSARLLHEGDTVLSIPESVRHPKRKGN